MQFSPLSCHFIPLRTKYSPQHPVLKHPHIIKAHTVVLQYAGLLTIALACGWIYKTKDNVNITV
jgi:hypothetical protein